MSRYLTITNEQRALLIAEAAHYGQYDKGGADRYLHVRHVGDQFPEGSIARIVGYLHDVIEDSPLTTIGALEKIFGPAVSSAVFAITRQLGEQYFDYIRRCRLSPTARIVKIEDIRHNSDKSRWPDMPDSYIEREQKALTLLALDPYIRKD